MKNILSLFIALFISFAAFSQETVQSKLSDFTSIKLQGNMDVTIEQSDDESSFTAELKDMQADKFEWSVANGVLSIRVKSPLAIGKDLPKPFAKVVIKYKDLKEINVNSAELANKGVLKGDVITIIANSKASVAIETICRDLTIDATNAKVSVTGETEYLTVKSQSSASVNTITMKCQNANILTTTNAECYATSIKKFEAKATTNSNIFYKGAPEIVKKEVATLGKIEAF